MAWARIDDNFFNHPKIYKAGKDAVLFHIAALCHSNAFLTEGFIEDAIIDLIGKQAFQKHPVDLANKLVEVELWERVEGGYYIHDFLKYNHSKAEIEQIKSKKSYAGSLGGRPSNKANEKQTESTMKAKEKQTESKLKAIPSPSHPKVIKPDEGGSARGKVFIAYENEIGYLTPFISESLTKALDEYSENWVLEAIHEAAAYSGKSFKYVEKVLIGWKQHGFKVDTRQKQTKAQYAPKSVNPGLDAVKAEMARMGMEFTGIFAKENNNG